MKYLLCLIVSLAFVVPADAQLFGDHSERQWLEGEVALYDPLQRFVEEDGSDELAADVSLTYVYAKAHENVHIVGSIRYLHPLNDDGPSHKAYGGGLRLYKWSGYAQAVVGEVNGELDVIVSAGYYVSPRIGVRANWYAGAEDNKAGHVSAGVVWRF